ncbi:hypothetical protein H0E87_000313, partial [Populus deltoides]
SASNLLPQNLINIIKGKKEKETAATANTVFASQVLVKFNHSGKIPSFFSISPSPSSPPPPPPPPPPPLESTTALVSSSESLTP